jgi:hypothetical protein
MIMTHYTNLNERLRMRASKAIRNRRESERGMEEGREREREYVSTCAEWCTDDWLYPSSLHELRLVALE